MEKRILRAAKTAGFYLIYTVLFLGLLYGTFKYFPENGRMIQNHADAFRQHLRAVAYYSKWLKGVFHNIFVLHNFDIQTFSFGMGYGSDLFTTLQYYAVGDILNLPSVFVKEEYIYIYFQVITLLRPYLAGIAFSLYLKYIRPQTSVFSMLAGMFIYSFGSYFLFLGIWHPFFANPLIYFPLLLFGAERIIKERKSFLFTIFVFLSATNNFYFFYTMVLLLIIYVVVRLLGKYGRNIKKEIECVGAFLLHGIIGTLMGMVILLPIILALMHNPRSGSGINVPFLYDKDYYVELIRNFVTFVYHGQYDLQLGFTGVFVVAVSMLIGECITTIIKKKKNDIAKEIIFFAVLLILTLVPFCGYMLAGFSYVIDRWCFAFALFAGVLIAGLADRLIKCEMISMIFTCIFSILFLLINYVVGNTDDEGLKYQFYISAAVFAISIMCKMIYEAVSKKNKNEMLMVISSSFIGITIFTGSVTGILVNAYEAYSPDKGNMISDYLEVATPEEMHLQLESTETQVTEEAAAQDGLDPFNDFYRYSGRNLVWNASLMDGISSTQFLWSLTDENVSDFFMAMANNDEQNFAYYGLDNRAILNAMNSVNYFSLRFNTPEERAMVPLGYDQCYEKYNFAIFKNENALPLGYGSGSFITKEEFDLLTPIQSQEALLYGTVIEEEVKDVELAKADPVFTSQQVPYEIKDSDGVKFTKSGIKVDGGAWMTLTFEGIPQSETYLYFEGIKAKSEESTLPITVSSTLSDGTSVVNTLNYKTEDSQYYSGWHDFLINLGYSEEAKNSMTINFAVPGKYTYDEMSVCCQPLNGITDKLMAYKADSLNNICLNKNPVSNATNKITGTFEASKDELMVINIPYSDGFTAYVDGEKQDIIRANIMFMAIPVTSGNHEVVLEYHTPGLRIGVLLSLLGLLMLIIYEIISRKRCVKSA